MKLVKRKPHAVGLHIKENLLSLRPIVQSFLLSNISLFEISDYITMVSRLRHGFSYACRVFQTCVPLLFS